MLRLRSCVQAAIGDKPHTVERSMLRDYGDTRPCISLTNAEYPGEVVTTGDSNVDERSAE